MKKNEVTIPARVVCELYNINPNTLAKWIKPFTKELDVIRPINVEKPGFNEKQLHLILDKLGWPSKNAFKEALLLAKFPRTGRSKLDRTKAK